jgi:hypothetical protein
MGDVLLYQAKGGIALEVRLQGDTVWLTQPQMAKLFGRERSIVTKHVNNVFAERELDRKSNVQNVHIASSDKPVALYSLDTIISVGYRVKSKQSGHERRPKAIQRAVSSSSRAPVRRTGRTLCRATCAVCRHWPARAKY